MRLTRLFARSYQQEYEEQYGAGSNIPNTRHTHKGKRLNRVTFKLKKDETFMSVFHRFWNVVARKTSYRIHMDEEELIRRSIESVNDIRINDYTLEVQSMRITDISNLNNAEYYGSESYVGRAKFNPHDLVEEISEKTGLCYTSVLKIIAGISNKDQYIKNPPVFMEQAVFKIRQVQLDELVRCIEYRPIGESYDFDFKDFRKDGCENWIETPNHGVWDKTLYDSSLEKNLRKKQTKSQILKFCAFSNSRHGIKSQPRLEIMSLTLELSCTKGN